MNHYRGKTKDTKKWIYGGISTIPRYNQAFINVIQNESYIASIEVEPESVGQYTGMEIDGVKLYDKMSFKYGDVIFTVSYNEDEYLWEAVSNNGKINRLPLWNFPKNRIEIIQD